MTPQEFEEKFKQGGAWLNRFYVRAVYHLGENPALFWTCFVLALIGAWRSFTWVPW